MSTTSMLVRSSAAACLAAAAVIAVGGPGHAAGAVVTDDEPIVGETIECATHTYTITAGSLHTVFHLGQTPSGNLNDTGTAVPRGVVLVDEAGQAYRLSGATWFGDTVSANGARGAFTAHFNILGASGGVVDRVAQSGHFNADGTSFFLDKGTCA